MSENLKLPICPKCNEIKYVEPKKINEDVIVNWFICVNCNVNWFDDRKTK